MDDLVTWLRAQLDEDERGATAASAALGGHGAFDPSGRRSWHDVDGMCPEEFEHIARHDPARVLREVEAKRLRIDYLAGLEHDMGPEDFVTFDSCRILAKPGELGDLDVGYCSCGLAARRERLYRIEALPYADRPGYRDEWKP